MAEVRFENVTAAELFESAAYKIGSVVLSREYRNNSISADCSMFSADTTIFVVFVLRNSSVCWASSEAASRHSSTVCAPKGTLSTLELFSFGVKLSMSPVSFDLQATNPNIKISTKTKAIAEEYHKAYMDALNAPVIQEYKAQYDEWSRIPIEKLDADAAQFRRNEKYMTDSFYAYWVSTHTEEEKAAYDTAWAVVQEKYNAYISMYDSVLLVAQREKTFEEANRLQDEGLMLVWKEYTEMVGFLTEEQITQFPVNESYGYYITWAEIPGNSGYFIDE